MPGRRSAEGPDRADGEALALGIASHARVAGCAALVLDTHVSPAHGRALRAGLEASGVRRIRVVLGDWHLDHVAGTAAFADREVIANARTAAHLARRRAAIEAGTGEGPHAIAPLILPGRVFPGAMAFDLGGIRVELVGTGIGSDGATLVWLPGPRILPVHGDPAAIAAGGPGPGLIAGTAAPLRWLLRPGAESGLAAALRAGGIGADPARGRLRGFVGHEAVHRRNVARVFAALGREAPAGHG